MATNFPTSLDALINPQPTDSVAVVSHASQHTNANDAIEALEAKVGVNNSAVTTSLDYRVKSLETAALDAEGIQDIAAALITNGSHTNITVSYSDDATPPRLNLVATYDDEEVMDAIATSLTAGTGIVKTYDDVANTITVSVDTTAIATQSYVTTAISNLIDSSPALLDTLNEIAAAIGDDANFATTMSNALALKAPLASPALTGIPTAPTATAGTNTTQVATTAFSNTAAGGAVTTANSYTDSAITSLSNSIAHPVTGYVPVGDIAQADGVASLGPDGFVPNTQLNIDERIQDTAALMITSATHTGISVTYDDNTGRLAFTAAALTAEVAQDFIAPLFAHAFHTNVTATYDDANNRIVLEGSAGSGSGTGGSLTNSWFLGA
jgi:hypothetical protein